jgi:murein DD-endopeptidase MepM/ murein hydrolase activator NlpD
MAKQKKEKSKYKIVFYDEKSLKEIDSWVVKFPDVLGYIGMFLAVVIFIACLVLIYTPLNRLLPRIEDKKYRAELISSALKLDSIKNVLEERNVYFVSIRNIIEGNLDSEVYSRDTLTKREKTNFAKSKHDSIMRTLIELEEQQTLAAINNENRESDKTLSFFVPVKGMVSAAFNANSGHFGVDIAAKEQTPIFSTLPGTVLLATWTSETGYVIQIQHTDNFVSIYKHNSTLLKKVGDKVAAGEPIAVVGNTGELTSGTHLHFELWHNGVAVNPENYIVF